MGDFDRDSFIPKLRNHDPRRNDDYYRSPLGGGGGGGAVIEFTITSIRTAASTGADAPYNGLTIATVLVQGASCSRASIIGTSVDVVDHSGCIFDLAEADLVDVWGWASEMKFLSLDPAAPEGELTPCHWSAADRCCAGTENTTSVTELFVGTSPPADTGLVWIDTSAL